MTPFSFSTLFPSPRKRHTAPSSEPPSGDPPTIGRTGEELARRHLEQNGYRILACNYRVRFGEIDLIAEEKGTLVFVEVKTRTGPTHGHPLEAVTVAKQRQLARVALHYLGNEPRERLARFDVVSVLLARDRPPQIEIIRNAFELPSGV